MLVIFQLLLLVTIIVICTNSSATDSLRSCAVESISRENLDANIKTLSAIGATTNDAVKRLSFTEDDVKGRELVMKWMRELDMSVKIDTAGNIIGTYPSMFSSDQKKDIPALATGSHIDTVPTGGKYDGALGVLAGLEVVRALKAQGEYLHHPIEVIVFTDEESTLIGSKAMSGRLDFTNLKISDFTTSIREPIDKCLRTIGGNFEEISKAARTPLSIGAFVELHVEQGGVLEKRGDAIGVVEGIVGQRRFTITINGLPNHAGTTPMNMRSDSLVAASKVVISVHQAATSYKGKKGSDPVATVGKLDVWPNAANIIPGQVNMTLEMRDLYAESLDFIYTSILESVNVIEAETNTKISIIPQFSTDSTMAADFIQDIIVEASSKLNLTHSALPSRAVHDSQEMGKTWPMAMIFVPSMGGYSHSHLEYTSSEQCAAGTAVLLETFRLLDERLPVE